MELNQLVKGKSVFLDTAPLIYFIEKHRRYYNILRPVISQIDALETEAITSTITLLEVLVHPSSGRQQKAGKQVQGCFTRVQRSGDLRDFPLYI